MNTLFKGLLLLVLTPVCLFSSENLLHNYFTLIDSTGKNISGSVKFPSKTRRCLNYSDCLQELEMVPENNVDEKIIPQEKINVDEKIIPQEKIKIHAISDCNDNPFWLIKEEQKNDSFVLDDNQKELQQRLQMDLQAAKEQGKLFSTIFENGTFKVIKPLALQIEQNLNEQRKKEKLSIITRILNFLKENRLMSAGSFLLTGTVFLLALFRERFVRLFFKVK